MTLWEALLLVVGGVVAGGVNAMAGGGSTLTVPLLVLAGVGGNDANGSNRVGILASNVSTALSFHRRGVTAYREAAPVLLPVVIGSLVGSVGVSRKTRAPQARRALSGPVGPFRARRAIRASPGRELCLVHVLGCTHS